MPLYHPAQAFYEAVAAMPKEFFEVYNYLRDKGVPHTVATQAAHEAWASDFKKKE